MSQFAREDSQAAIDLVSDGDVVLESDRNQDGVGDLVFRTAGVERARIKHDGSGTGWSNVLGGSSSLTALRKNLVRNESLLVNPRPDRTVTAASAPTDVTVTSSSGSSSSIVGTAQTFAANLVSKFRWTMCRLADQASPFNPISPGGTCDGTAGSANVTNVSQLSLANTNTVIVYDPTGSRIISQANTTISSGGGTSSLTLSKTLTEGGTGLLIGVPVGTYRANCPQPNLSAGGPDSAIVSSFDYMAQSALTEITIFTRKSPATGSWYEIYVDGALVQAITQSPSSIGNRSVVHIALTSARTHHVRMVSRGVDILQVQAGPNDTIWLPRFPLYRARAVIIGDSYTASANDSYGRGYWVDVCEQMGWECVNCGQSGSGYTLTGSSGTGATTYGDRVALVASEAPDVLIFAGGLNDVGASGIQAAAAAAFASAQATFPNVPVIVVGPQDTPGAGSYNSTNLAACDAAIQAAANAAPNVIGYISVLGWITGTGTTGNSRTVTDGATTSGSKQVTSATANFTSADLGKVITGSGIPSFTTIATVTNSTTIQLSANATATATGVSLTVTKQTGSGNADVLMSNDPAHPLDAGHRYYGQRTSQHVAALVAAQSLTFAGDPV